MTDTLDPRTAQEADAPALCALVNSAYRGDSSRQGWTTEADLLDGQRTDPAELARLMRQAGHVFLLFHEADQLLASVHLEDRGDHAYLGMLTVKPDIQARGLGKTVMAAAERWVRSTWGSTRVRMTVISVRHELIAWYVRRGYRDTGERQPFPSGDARFGIPKVDSLEFVVLEKSLTDPS